MPVSNSPSDGRPASKIPSRALSATRPELRGISRSRIIGVAIDPAKTVHKVLVFDFNLDILEGPFDIDALRSGWERLLAAIERAKRLRRAQRVVIGLEASGSYSLHLSRELSREFRYVYFFNPLSVATARKQKLLLGQKTDAIDVAVIGDLLLRGQGYPVREPQRVYIELRERTYWRHQRIGLIRRLKQQMIDRVGKVYPGITARPNGAPPLVRDIDRNSLVKALIEEQLTPHQILALSPVALRQRLMPYLGIRGRPSAKRLQTCTQNMLFGEEDVAQLELTLLKRDLMLLRHIEEERSVVEEEMVALVRQTPGRWLLGQIRGLSDLQVACYIGALGDPRWFKSAKQAYSLAGLSPRQHESGVTKTRKSGVTKTGRQLLRTTLFQMAGTVARHEPIFRGYLERLYHVRKKHYRTAQIATANKLNRTLIALMASRQPFRRGERPIKKGATEPVLG